MEGHKNEGSASRCTSAGCGLDVILLSLALRDDSNSVRTRIIEPDARAFELPLLVLPGSFFFSVLSSV